MLGNLAKEHQNMASGGWNVKHTRKRRRITSHTIKHRIKKRRNKKTKEKVEEVRSNRAQHELNTTWSHNYMDSSSPKLPYTRTIDYINTEDIGETSKIESRRHAIDEVNHKPIKRKHGHDCSGIDSQVKRDSVKKRKKISKDCSKENKSLDSRDQERSTNQEENKKHRYKKVKSRHKERSQCETIKRQLKQAKKSLSNNAEYETFIVDNNLIHYVWKPSKELQEKLGFRKGKWTKEEESILKENMDRFLCNNNIDYTETLLSAWHWNTQEERRNWREFADSTGFYQEICKGLKRSLKAVVSKTVHMFDEKNYLGTFSKEEDERLLKLVAIHGRKWSKISVMMGRNYTALSDRYIIIKDKLSCINGSWHEDEIFRLMNAVRKITNTENGEAVYCGIPWAKVSSIVKTRNSYKCRKKWLNDICWKDSHFGMPAESWNQENDVELISRIYESQVTEECDIDWLALYDCFEKARSPAWLRAKFCLFKRKHCKSIDLENTQFEEVIDYLYNVATVDIQNKLIQSKEKKSAKE